MLNLITEIIQKFGPRTAGSEAEKNAQLFMVEKCKSVTDKVQLLEFEAYLNARFGKLKYYCAVFFIALVLYFVSPIAALIISFINALAFVFDFMTYRVVLESFPGPLMKSWNVEASLEPQGEVKNTLIFSGHIDSVFEFKWWYKLGQHGIHLNIVAGILMVLLPLFYVFMIAFPEGNWHWYMWIAIVILSPSTVTYFNMHGANPVAGACDNLSGVAIAFEVFKNFADANNKGKSVLKNTRLKFVSFGSEETGLTGSCKYVEAKADELKKENAHVINIDSIRLPEAICIIKAETMNGTSYDKNLIAQLQNCFGAVNIPIKTGVTPIGGTDGVFFIRAGIPAVSIIGLGMDKLDPTYHTRRDVVENVNPIALDNAANGLAEFVRQWDDRGDKK